MFYIHTISVNLQLLSDVLQENHVTEAVTDITPHQHTELYVLDARRGFGVILQRQVFKLNYFTLYTLTSIISYSSLHISS